MRSFFKAAAVTGCLMLALGFLAPPLIHGDEWNLSTRFTVNHKFEVPGMVLQPNTPYVIRLYDSPSTRNVVQIYNADQTKMLTMFMAISAELAEPADRTVFKFIEMNPGFPLPIKEWFYPGRLNGLEFVYPKEQALRIAEHAQEAVLAASATDLHRLDTITVEAIGPIGTPAPAAESAAVVEEQQSVAQTTPSESNIEQKNEVEQIAQNTEPVVQQPEPAVIETPPAVVETPAPAVSEPTVATEESQELPRTAGELPLVALIGVLCVGAGLGLRALSARSQM